MTKTILITGATSGFGAAAAKRFAEAGWRVIATGRRAERLQPLVERFGADKVHAAVFDIRDEAALEAALARIAGSLPRHRRAGQQRRPGAGHRARAESQPAGLAHHDRHQHHRAGDADPSPAAGLIERKGVIINISSIAATYPYPGGNTYGGSKAFVTQFSLGPALGPARHRRARDFDRAGHGRNRIHAGAHAWRPGGLGQDVRRRALR